MTKQQEWIIHNHLHDKSVKTLRLEGGEYPILLSSNMCRYVVILDWDGQYWEYMEQNPNTKSIYAKRTQDGERLTWRIPRKVDRDKPGPRVWGGGWRLITDDDKPSVEEIKPVDIIL